MEHQATRHIAAAQKQIPGKNTNLTVIIPAAGLGRRMNLKDPKCLVEIDGQSLIERQLDIIWRVYPKSDIFVVIGHGASLIRKKLGKYPVRFIYNPLFETTNVAFSISLALQASLGDKCLIVYGDLVFNKEAISSITGSKSRILLDPNQCINSDEVGLVTDEYKNVSNFSFGLSNKWAQIAYLEYRELELFKEACYNEDAVKWFGYEALNQIIDKGGTLMSHNILSSLAYDVDTVKELNEVRTIFNE